MNEGYVRLPIGSTAGRWGFAAAIAVVAAAMGLMVVRWGIAESVVDTARRTGVTSELIDAACRLQPQNPETAYIAALYALDTAQPPDIDGSGRMLERAVSLAPNRPAYWLALGRQREVAGQPDEAEQAFLRAIDAAPSHWRPRWMLANLLIRQGRTAEAIGPLRETILLYPSMAPIAARIVWAATGRGDVDALNAVVSSTPAGRAALVGLWVSEGRLDEALARWNELVADAGLVQVAAESGMQLAEGLRAAGRGGEYADIVSRLNPERAALLDTVANAGFEEPISESESSPFAWKATRSTDARISVDAGRGGGKALRIDYNSKGGAIFEHAAQSVRVEPGAEYTLSIWVIAEKLQTGGPPMIVIGDGSSANAILGSMAVPSSATDWTPLSVRFTAPPSGLVTIRIRREPCGPVCPVLGTVLFDDVLLSR